MTWDDHAVAELRRLWAEGHATRIIGAYFGANKNQIIGKAHRLRLPSRPSPLPNYVPKPPVARPQKAVKPVVVAPPPPPPPPPPPVPSVRLCQYPHGDPGEPGFHYCGAPVWRGVYCRACYRRCYHSRVLHMATAAQDGPGTAVQGRQCDDAHQAPAVDISAGVDLDQHQHTSTVGGRPASAGLLPWMCGV